MAESAEQKLLRRIARLYWLEDRDQAEIGHLLGISKSTVSRKLAAARASGIVQVRVVGEDSTERVPHLEREIRERSGLREVLVADVDPGVDQLRGVGHLGADVFVEHAVCASRIGFSWGLSVAAVIGELPPLSLRSDTVLTPIVGGMPSVDAGPSGNNLIFSLAETCGVRAQRVDAPAVVESATTRTALIGETSVMRALEFARGCELAFVGIGAFGVRTSEKVLAQMRLSDAERAAVRAAAPVGDMLGRFYDAAGTPLGPPTADRVIGLDLEDLRRIPTVVGIAAGAEKLQGVLGAIATGALDVLVIDRRLAEGLLVALPAPAQAAAIP